VGFGNATWETASWDNRNAHNWSLSRATTSPSRSSFTDVTGTVETGAGGYGPVYTTNQGRGVVTPQMMASAGHEWSQQADRFTQIGQTQSLQAQESWRAATQNAISYVRDNSSYSRETGAYTWQDGARMSSQQQAIARSLDIISNDLGITDTSAATRVFDASLGAGTTQFVRAAGGISMRNSSDQQIADAVHKVRQVSRDAGLSDEKGIVHAVMASGGFETGATATRRGAMELRASHETATAYERQASSSFSEAQALRSAASVVARDGFAITGDDTYAIHRRAESERVSRAAMNDPGVMMDVARRHFLEKYGVSLGIPPNDLNPSAPAQTADQLSAPTFSNGTVASAESMQRKGSTVQAEVSGLNRAEGVAEHASPSLRDTASHFVGTKQRAQTDVQAREQRLGEDEQALHGERGRRFDGKSPFTNANPGDKPEPEPEPPLTTQWEFYTGGEEKPTNRP